MPGMIDGMPLKEMREWAREELLDAADDWIRDHKAGLDATDESVLIEQRNRIAKMFKKKEVLTF